MIELSKTFICESDKLLLREIYEDCAKECLSINKQLGEDRLKLQDQLIMFGKIIADNYLYDSLYERTTRSRE
jgi:hypothetical protein